ncbi:hypothetical protein [Moraxella bovis]|uniref:Uncharacterized protein n=1 Tax=Moraxella bovis TaxID=476 RepID=A0ABY6M2Z5_MORBO|nr:hypothetical protein [Moraxella bovis]UZA02081.1 hypothetical protein LP092_08725 [Moraxella bovis]UZA18327.1 hypothetical protein LP088_08140 [Moraxella bovis]UZA36480.1 hypothetical protein LP098_05800 [Moraxella bovis]
MTLSDLINEFRALAFDEVEPYLFDDDKVIHWLNQALDEACVRGRLIHECDDPAVCTIAINPNQTKYNTHPKLYEITHASLELPSVNGGRRENVCLVSFEEMSRADSDWRDEQDKHRLDPYFLIQHDTYVRLSRPTDEIGVLHLEGYRLPHKMTNDDDVPEIHLAHHEHLIDWALHKAFGVPDSEVFDMNKSEMAEQRFTNYFGFRPDSDLRRITRHDVPHAVKPFWV